MRASAVLILAPLITGTLALPQKRQTHSADEVTAAMNTWLSDVEIVNTFFNNQTGLNLAPVALG